MAKDLLIGCDIGTSGTKAVVTGLRGEVLAHAVANYGVVTPRNLWAEQWPDVWLDAAVETICRVASRFDPSDFAGLCISALYGGTGAMCDAGLEPIRPALIWMDRRAELEGKEVGEAVGHDTILDVTGNGTDSYFGYVKLLWVKKHEPENWKRIRHILPVHSYVIAKMTGAFTIDHSSAGNLGGVYDYKRHAWSSEMAERLGIDIAAMPQTLNAAIDVAGGLSTEYAGKLSLREGLPVCVGTVDCLASMLSAGIVALGDNAVVLGTSLNWGFLHDKIPSDANLISMPYCLNPTAWSYTYGGASTAGALPRWFCENFAGGESQETYQALENGVAAKRIPAGAEGLVVLPYFMGERTPIWDENACGEIVGLSLNHSREHVYQAVLESAAYSLRHIMESMGGTDEVKKVVLVGGGAKSMLWRRIFSDVVGLPLHTTVKPVEAPLGGAFMAGLATGKLKGLETIYDWIEFDLPVQPIAENHAAYDGYFAVYKDLYLNTREQMKTLKDLSFSTKYRGRV